MAARDRAVQLRHTRGFTLVELLIALVIISILAAVAIPAYSSKVRQARQTDAQRNLMSLAQTEEIYRFQNGAYTNNIGDLTNLGWASDSAWYPTANFQIPKIGTNPPNAPPDGTNALGIWFQAQASGNIGGAVPDQWTITNNGVLNNPQNGT